MPVTSLTKKLSHSLTSVTGGYVSLFSFLGFTKASACQGEESEILRQISPSFRKLPVWGYDHVIFQQFLERHRCTFLQNRTACCNAWALCLIPAITYYFLLCVTCHVTPEHIRLNLRVCNNVIGGYICKPWEEKQDLTNTHGFTQRIKAAKNLRREIHM